MAHTAGIIAVDIWVIMSLLRIITGVILLIMTQPENNPQRPDILYVEMMAITCRLNLFSHTEYYGGVLSHVP